MIYAIFIFLSLLLTSCSQEEPEDPKTIPKKAAVEVAPVQQEYSCTGCHQYSLDSLHDNFTCIDCHKGKSPAPNEHEAHASIVEQPSHPDYMEENCSPCHASLVKQCRSSLHFTLRNEINTIRKTFGAETLQTLLDIPKNYRPETAAELSNDLLRRRCLRCHVYYEGDPYSGVTHGTGCAACHMVYANGSLQSHDFVKSPPDSQCLHCHYSNFVGSDYYGRYEHDFHWDYRTPYLKDGTSDRPFGIEYRQLRPDIHQLSGLSCIDCHSGAELMTVSKQHKITCRTCHLTSQETKQTPALDNVSMEDGHLTLTTKHGGRKLEIPLLQHPVHEKYAEHVHCQVCHAQWSYTDKGTHLLRQDEEDYDPFDALSVQGSFEVEVEVATSLYGDESYPYPFMVDKITGESARGLWFKGFELRRWEFPIVCKNEAGILHICRPILDIYLTYLDEEEDVIIDAASPQNIPFKGLSPYIPHTTGKAGAFYQQRLKENSSLLDYPLFLEKSQGQEKTP